MKAPVGESGYALLAAVLIIALAAVFSAAAAGAVGATLGVQASDAAAGAAAVIAGQTVDRACAVLVRHPDRVTWTAAGSAGVPAGAWDLACSPVPAVEPTAGVRVDVLVSASAAAARRRLHLVLELTAAPGGRGLVVAHDVRVEAPLTVSGGGLYSGGSVTGREWVTFVGAGDGASPPVDGVYGETWPVAAVHALGGIWATGVEVHESPAAGYDTDVHTGSGVVEAAVRPPSPVQETLLDQTADVRLTAAAGGVVDVSALPSAPPSGAGALVAVVDDAGTPVTVVGERPSGACPVVLVLRGDACLGAAGAPFALSGAVVSLGSLTVGGPASVEGHLWAAALTVAAPLAVASPADWRRRPLPGLVAPVVLALGR